MHIGTPPTVTVTSDTADKALSFTGISCCSHCSPYLLCVFSLSCYRPIFHLCPKILWPLMLRKKQPFLPEEGAIAPQWFLNEKKIFLYWGGGGSSIFSAEKEIAEIREGKNKGKHVEVHFEDWPPNDPSRHFYFPSSLWK